MRKLVFVFAVIISTCIPCQYSNGQENFIRPTMLSVRALLFLKKEVAISKVMRGDVGIYKELAEDPEVTEGQDDSEKLRLKRYPPGDFCFYFTFECDLNMEEMIGSAAVLKDSKVGKIDMEKFLVGFWIVPQFPAKFLHETDGIRTFWHRGNGLFKLCLTALPLDQGSDRKFVYYGCCEVGGLPTNGTYPSLGFDKDGKIVEPKR